MHSPIVLSTSQSLLCNPGAYPHAPSRISLFAVSCVDAFCQENSCDRIQSLWSSPAVRVGQIGIPSTRATYPDQPLCTVVGAGDRIRARGHGRTDPRNSEARAAAFTCADRVSIPSSLRTVRFQYPRSRQAPTPTWRLSLTRKLAKFPLRRCVSPVPAIRKLDSSDRLPDLSEHTFRGYSRILAIAAWDCNRDYASKTCECPYTYGPEKGSNPRYSAQKPRTGVMQCA